MKYQRFIVLSLSLLACGSPVTFAQDHRDVPVPREERPPESRRENPEDIRELVQHHRERLDRQNETLREIEAMLDRGDPMPRIRERLRALPPGGPREPRVPGDHPKQFDGPEHERMHDPIGREDSPPHEGDGPMDRPPPLTRAQQMELLEEVAPEFSHRLRRVEERDPAAADRMLGNVRRRLMGLWEQRRRSPEEWPQRREMFGLELQATETARVAAQGPEEERDAASERLRGILSRQFELRAEFAERELARVEQRAIELHEQVERHQGERDDMIERRAAEMIERASKRPPPPPRHEQGGPRRPEDRHDSHSGDL